MNIRKFASWKPVTRCTLIIILASVMFACSVPFVPPEESVEIVPQGDSSWVNSIAISYDGKFLAYGGGDNAVRLWDIETGKLLQTLEEHSDPVSLVMFSPDGEFIVSGSNDNTIILWDRKSGKPTQTFDWNSDCVNSTTFSPDGRFIAYGGEDNNIYLWDIKKRRPFQTFRSHSECANPIAFSSDNKFVIHGDTDGIVRILDLNTDETIISLIVFEDDEWIAYTPKGYYACSEKGDEQIAFKVKDSLYDAGWGSKEKHKKCAILYKRPDVVAHALQGSASTEPVTEKQAFPPDIQIKQLKFVEPSGNEALDGREQGAIEFNLVNKGRGDAHHIEIKLTPLTSSKNISFTNTRRIIILKSKKLETVSFPIKADIKVQTMKREFRIDVLESDGFDSEPGVIDFQTQAFAAPDLRIEMIAVDDSEDKEGQGKSYGNGNSVIEPGESVEVVAYVQNFGQGHAKDVKAKLILKDNNNITCPDENKIFNLGDIKSNDYGKKVEFYFFTNKQYQKKNIPFSIELTESLGIFGKTCDLDLKIGKKAKKIDEVKPVKTRAQTKSEMPVTDDVDKNIPVFNVNGENTLAIIIGIEEYKYAPKAAYASNDARIFYKYAKSVFGIPARNIYYRINHGATSGEFNKVFADDGWIARRLKQNQTDIIIYYSGHGAPDTKSKRAYLIPNDIDPNYAKTGFSLDRMYSSLSRLKAKSVTVFLDSCFSGESRTNEMLIDGIRPISIETKNPVLTKENMAVFTASAKNQYSSAYPEKQHGLFTYYLLKALKGKAAGSDNTLTLKELYEFVKENVEETAGYLDKEQTPTFIGRDGSRVLLKF
jgi:hypothetical protein